MPLGTIDIAASVQSATEAGIGAGYQTMDVMAAMILSSSILITLAQKHYTTKEQQFRMISRSGIIAAAFLFIVYGGLAYLGATVSGIYGPETDRVALLIAITKALLGEKGMILLGILVCAACMTPAIGLLSSSASFFEKQTGNRISYRTFVFLFAGVSFLISNFGISRILKLAAPILNMIYPVLILLVVLGMMNKWISHRIIYRLSALSVIAVSTLTTLSEYIHIPFDIASLPLYQYGFQWITPALLCGLLGLKIAERKHLLSPVFLGNVGIRA